MGHIRAGWVGLTKKAAIVITWLGFALSGLLTALTLIGAPSDVKAAPGQLAEIVSWLATTPWWVPALGYAVFAVALLVLVLSSYLKAEARHEQAMRALADARIFFAENTASLAVTSIMARLAEIQRRQGRLGGFLSEVAGFEGRAYELLVWRRDPRSLAGVSRETIAQAADSFPAKAAEMLEQLAPGTGAARIALMEGMDVTVPVAREDEVQEEDRELFRRVVHTANAAREGCAVANAALIQSVNEISNKLHETEIMSPLTPQ